MGHWRGCGHTGGCAQAGTGSSDFAPLSAGQKMTGVECVEGMASGLYEELFAALVSMINRYEVSTVSCRAW